MPTPRLNLALGQLDPLYSSGNEIARRTFSARFVRAGRIRTADNQPGPIEITPAALTLAVERGLFNGKAVFVDHAGSWENPSLRNLVGVTKDSAWTGDSVEGLIEMYATPDSQAVADLLTEVLSQGESAPDVGLSIVFFPVWESISTFLLPCTLRLPKPPRNLDYLPHNNLLRDPNYLNILISTI